MTPQTTRKAMRDLYRECNPFTPEPRVDFRSLLQDVASLISLAAFVIAAAFVAIASAPSGTFT